MSSFTMPLRDYMHSPVHTVQYSTSLAEAERRLSELDIGALPVLDADGKPTGIVSRTDLLRIGRIRPTNGHRRRAISVPDGAVVEVMTASIETLSPDASVQEAARRMAKERIHRVFAEEKGSLVGAVSTKEMMRVIVDKRVSLPLSELMTTSVVVVRASDPLQLAIDRMAASHVQGVVVVDEGWPVGVFTQVEALEARDAGAQAPVEQWMNPAVLCLPEEMPVHRAASQAIATKARRIVAMDSRDVRGVLSGLDFARIVKS